MAVEAPLTSTVLLLLNVTLTWPSQNHVSRASRGYGSYVLGILLGDLRGYLGLKQAYSR